MQYDPKHQCNVDFVNKPTSNGKNNIVGQCSICGRHHGKQNTDSALRHHGSIQNIPLWNEKLAPVWYASLDEYYKKTREQQRIEWFKDYNVYLRTPEWREKSRMVRERSKLCQGCRKNPSEEAHHMYYDNVGQEFLFELVALCRQCHERFHERKKAKYNR